jgi:hypothetical protein
MSTKIYYGKKLNIRDLAHLKELLEGIRLKVEQKVLKDFPSSLLTEKKINYDDYVKLIQEHEFEFAVGYDSVTSSYYGFLLGYHGQQKLLDGISEFEDFGYWDNSDPPDDVPEEEFYAREEVWERLMPGCSTIGEQMFCISLKIRY